MGCRRGKSKAKRKSGRYQCRSCGAVVKRKSEACEPEKTKLKKRE